MSVSCAICISRIGDSEACNTPCGHVFHRACILESIRRSTRTCPQCRRDLCERQLKTLYFNYSDTNSEDGQAQIRQINALKEQLRSLNVSLRQSKEQNQLLERQKAQSSRDMCGLNTELIQRQSVIDGKENQIKQLQKEIQTYQKIQTLLSGTMDDTSEIVTQTHDAVQLHTYIRVMKRELLTSVDRQRQLRNEVRSLQADIRKIQNNDVALAEERDKRKLLEAELMTGERTRLMLQYKIKQLEANAGTSAPSSIKTSSVHAQKSTENSPYLRVKSQGVFAAREHAMRNWQTAELGSSILAKKSLRVNPLNGKSVTTSKSTYDGYGGHAKYDRFPSPISGFKLKRSIDESKRDNKKPKFDSNDNQKLDEILDIPSLK